VERRPKGRIAFRTAGKPGARLSVIQVVVAESEDGKHSAKRLWGCQAGKVVGFSKECGFAAMTLPVRKAFGFPFRKQIFASGGVAPSPFMT
jgi:hypothetical protein